MLGLLGQHSKISFKKKWGFPLFYWDYTLGVILLSLVFGLTLGSTGDSGQAFLPNLGDASLNAIFYALLGGVIFNIANLLLVAAIDIAGMAIAFPIGIGIALVLGVLVNYIATPVGDPMLLFVGVGLVALAIVVDALAYKKISKGAGKILFEIKQKVMHLISNKLEFVLNL